MKKYYEIMYIVKPIEEDAFKEVVAKFDKLITENGGKVELWWIRKNKSKSLWQV